MLRYAKICSFTFQECFLTLRLPPSFSLSAVILPMAKVNISYEMSKCYIVSYIGIWSQIFPGKFVPMEEEEVHVLAKDKLVTTITEQNKVPIDHFS